MRVVLTVLLLLVAACDATESQKDVLQAALSSTGQRIDTIVFAPDLPEETRQAAAMLYPVTQQATIRPANGYDFPAHHFLLESVTVSGATAKVSGMFGPVPSARPGVALLACGSHMVFSLERESGFWLVGETSTTVC